MLDWEPLSRKQVVTKESKQESSMMRFCIQELDYLRLHRDVAVESVTAFPGEREGGLPWGRAAVEMGEQDIININSVI